MEELTRSVDHIFSFSIQMTKAVRQLRPLCGHISTAGVGCWESWSAGASGTSDSGLVRQPGSRDGDSHTGRKVEPDWALLEGFFASPSLNESNPCEWMGNERLAPEILAFLIMFIINSRTLIISLHSFCLINKWCACTFGLVYTKRANKRGRARDKRSNTALKAQEMENDTNREVVIIIFDQATGGTIWSQVATNN